jgi:hypothetical protein
VSHRAENPQDGSDDQQDDPDGPQDGQAGEGADDERTLPRMIPISPLGKRCGFPCELR